MVAIILKLYLLDYMIEMLIKSGVGLVGKQCRDHPQDRPENPEPVDVLQHVGPAYGVESPEPPVPILSTCVVLFALIQQVLAFLEIEGVCNLVYLGALLFFLAGLSLPRGEAPSYLRCSHDSGVSDAPRISC